MRARLTIRGADAGAFDVEIGNTATLGRSSENTVAMPGNKRSSRQHAIIRCYDVHHYQIMDLGSRNGTYINDRRVLMPEVLEDGDTIRLGDFEIAFQLIEESIPPVDTMEKSQSITAIHHETAVAAVMICDIRGFAALSEKLPRETLSRCLGEWFRHAGEIIYRHGGSIDKFIADGLLAHWHCEQPGGKEASHALAAAYELVRQAETMRWPDASGDPVNIAVALHHGSLAYANIGLVASRDATIIGDTVNTVFRIETVMKPLQQRVAVSEDFLIEAAPEEAVFSDLGEHQLKGKSRLVRLFGIS